MRPIFIAAVIAALPLGAAGAQSLGERIPGQRAEPGMPRSGAAPGGSIPCPQYGPGFMRVSPGGPCVRIGGQVRFEYGAVGGRSRDVSGSGMRSGIGVELEARTETEAGPLRAVVRGQATSDTGVMRGQRW